MNSFSKPGSGGTLVGVSLRSKTTATLKKSSCCWNVAQYKWEVHNGKIEIIFFVVKFRS